MTELDLKYISNKDDDEEKYRREMVNQISVFIVKIPLSSYLKRFPLIQY